MAKYSNTKTNTVVRYVSVLFPVLDVVVGGGDGGAATLPGTKSREEGGWRISCPLLPPAMLPPRCRRRETIP